MPSHPTLHWKKAPGSLDSISAAGAGIYASSDGGRFAVWVSRHRQGDPGRRYYAYHYFATDYGIPNRGQRYTEIPVPDTARSSGKKVKAVVEAWAALQPLPPTGTSTSPARAKSKGSLCLRLENDTQYVTQDLANLFAKGLAALGSKKSRVIRCVSHKPSHSASETEASRGIAYVGKCDWKKGEKGSCEAKSIVLCLPPPHQMTLRRLARLLEHELQHTFGMEHEDMSKTEYWSTGKLPGWAKGCTVRTKDGRALKAG